jgi:hypothetical protein
MRHHILAVTLLAAVSVLPRTAAAQWQQGDAAASRLVWTPGAAMAKSYSLSVFVNPSAGGQSDVLQMGDLRTDGKAAWITWQTVKRGGFARQSPQDGIKAIIRFFADAAFSPSGEETISTIPFGDLPVSRFAVTFGDGSRRDCALWRRLDAGATVAVMGYYCAEKNGALSMGDLSATLNALTLKTGS